MPRSVQSATRCACGIDMVTQHRNEAIASIANTTFGGQPNTFGVAPCGLHRRWPPAPAASAGRSPAIGTITATSNTA